MSVLDDQIDDYLDTLGFFDEEEDDYFDDLHNGTTTKT